MLDKKSSNVNVHVKVNIRTTNYSKKSGIMISMKDVARLAGVSVMTVSRVVNQSAPVDDDTRSKVEEAIRKLNYRPNLLARTLRQRDSESRSLVIPPYALYEHYREYATTDR